MGLDVTGYEKVRLIKRMEDFENPEDAYEAANDGDLLVLTHCEFKRARNLAEGIYETLGQVHDFRAGSYSGYNAWREGLAQMAGHGSAQSVWDAASPAGPFVELINFSDCEGFIGPTSSAKLARDFEQFSSAAQEFRTNRHRWHEHYLEFSKAFSLAAGSGCVEFS